MTLEKAYGSYMVTKKKNKGKGEKWERNFEFEPFLTSSKRTTINFSDGVQYEHLFI